MKILDKYLLKTFLITFTTVFVILFFIFILQTIWLFISELAGKDLDIFMILKFLMFSMPRIIPLVLPLSVLLASIMTFGNLAENYEFAAIKSSGISLQRAMRSLTVFILLLSVVAFFFANNVIPYAEFKFINFRKNIAQVQPALAISEGQFSDVGVYNIKVNKKSGKKGSILTGVTIHKKSNIGDGSKTVIKAKDGELISNEESNTLQLVLNEGNYYEDIVPQKYEERSKLPFARSSFKKYTLNIDLSQLNQVDVDENRSGNTNTMLTVNELSYTLDSLRKNLKTEIISYSENNNLRTGISSVDTTKRKVKEGKLPENILSLYSKEEQLLILTIANSNVLSVSYAIEASKINLINKQKNINNHVLAFYEKFVVAYACIMMFFIGAPLGAIIRKGGLGLPIIFAVLIFIAFHFINTFGKRISQEDGLSPFLGSWLSSIILTPLALLLTHRATNDIGLINMDVVLAPIQKIIKKIFPSKK
ncbi:LptF/LptG family permease [Flavobacterium sp. F-380]|uniref:LptF/LptG family permease n=1 Tax=Flavobacterium kayseriense TaxID=2764714 RepID=A0ABR7JBE0_9FLAO|nr:LptF/LptG family permease [Flavobacterium kayseriense]MBC5842649.1 LptF/LptG family permease [Flavobacterium kayseriense]MBC5849179.1 LptF/LptG family permease [Flavobacterium kayseriense]